LKDHLYHYTSTESLAAILDSGTIRLSPLSQTNDPCEYNEWITDLFFSSRHDGSRAATSDEIGRAMADVDRLLRRNVCVGCFTVDRKPRREAGTDHFFHMGWARARMWDQYAKKQTGACLVFNQMALVESVENACASDGIDCERMQGTVDYWDEPRTLGVALDAIWRDGVDKVVEGMRTAQNAPKALYYAKNYDWASEEEYRITVVRSNPEESELDRPLVVPFTDALEAIVVGEHFPGTELSVIRHRKASKGDQLFQCHWIDGAPALERL
jgi:hypothetical protein